MQEIRKTFFEEVPMGMVEVGRPPHHRRGGQMLWLSIV